MLSKKPMSISVRCKCWMLTSAVTCMPDCLAWRINSTDSAVETRAICNLTPVACAIRSMVCKAMLSAAKKLEFLEAARLRDELIRLEDELAAKSKN